MIPAKNVPSEYRNLISNENEYYFILDWKSMSKIPWELILLLGSGYTLVCFFLIKGGSIYQLWIDFSNHRFADGIQRF
jgi:hypothetical protein